MIKLFCLVITLLAALSCTARNDSDKSIDRMVDRLLGTMTVQEKLGQMTQLLTSKGEVTGPTGEIVPIDEYIKKGLCGSILSLKDPKEIDRLQHLAVDSSRLHIPILFGSDFIHGCQITFPENLGMSCSWNEDAVESYARVAAHEAASRGIPWTFSPMCDVSADPRWGRVSEGSGEDPYLSGRMSAAMVRGYQGDDLSDRNTILACVKHYAAYGAPEAGREYNTVDMSDNMFRERYLPSYKAAIKAGAATVMSSFNDFDGIPASGSTYLMKDILRDELGFKGFVVTDYNAISEMQNHRVAESEYEAALLALNAYINMDMVDMVYLRNGEQLIKDGKIKERHLDELIRPILKMKYRLGLFDDPFKYGNGRYKTETFLPENMEIARDVARRSMVLLRNEGNVLPIKDNRRIALIGPFADHRREMLGAWAGFSVADSTVSFAEGLKERFGNVTCIEGCKPMKAIPGGISEAVAAANQSDVVLITLGLPNFCGGEAASLTSISIPDCQKDLLRAVAATGKPTVILLVTGRAMDLSEESALCDALLVTWHPGTMAGYALADVISGDFNPAGRLSMSFPRNIGQVPIHYNEKSTGRPNVPEARKPKYTSKYLFTPNDPLYRFGFGLSYTDFEYSDLTILNPEVDGEDIKVRVTVTNTGSCYGTETVQLYVRDEFASTTRPVRELKSFKQVSLNAGESAVVDLTVEFENLAFGTRDNGWAVEKGDFTVFVGHDSSAHLSAGFKVLRTRKCRAEG